jgi:hypothetical protein
MMTFCGPPGVCKFCTSFSSSSRRFAAPQGALWSAVSLDRPLPLTLTGIAVGTPSQPRRAAFYVGARSGRPNRDDALDAVLQQHQVASLVCGRSHDPKND